MALHDHLETWIEAFLVDRKAQNLSDGTLLFYRKKLSLLLQFAETQLITQVSQLEPDVIRRWLMWLEQGAHNPGGIHACYRTLRAFVRWYWQETDQPGNPPTAKVKAPRVDLEPLVPVELDQVQALIKTCDKTLTGLRDKAIFMVLLDTGMRAGELLALDLDDIDLVSGAATVRHSKSRKPRTVFFSQPTRRAIRAYLKLRLDDFAALFVTDTGRLSYWGLRTMLDRRSEVAGVADVTLHSFRRAFAIGALRAGVDVFSLQELLGHSDLQVLRRYLRQTNDDLRLAHSKINLVEQVKGR
jgi:integrase/recombinase XerD